MKKGKIWEKCVLCCRQTFFYIIFEWSSDNNKEDLCNIFDGRMRNKFSFVALWKIFENKFMMYNFVVELVEYYIDEIKLIEY